MILYIQNRKPPSFRYPHYKLKIVKALVEILERFFKRKNYTMLNSNNAKL